MDELEKYRPKNIYKEKEELEIKRPEMTVDDYGWETNYQIGPDTLLLATRGAAFNARVRDYRRELWGDGAPLVNEGILGLRNADITVRERRRFTDLVREDPSIAASVNTITEDMCAKHISAFKRNNDTTTETDSKNNENEQKLENGNESNIFLFKFLIF